MATTARSLRIEEDLVGQLFNSSELGLARGLAVPANCGSSDGPREVSLVGLSEETLAPMIGATRSRVNVLMKKFQYEHFMDYHPEPATLPNPVERPRT